LLYTYHLDHDRVSPGRAREELYRELGAAVAPSILPLNPNPYTPNPKSHPKP